ncbi:hypothetical protein D3C80_1339160 [compost metagenome]
MPASERQRIGPPGEFAHLGHIGFEAGGAVGYGVVIPGRGRIGRHQYGKVVVRPAVAVDHQRQQDHAIELHALVLKPIGQTGGPGGAVGFAKQIFGRSPALVHRDVAGDEAGEGIHVLLGAPEIASGRVADRPRIAGPDGVDEDEVRLVEDAAGAVANHVGRGTGRGRGARDSLNRTDAADVQPMAG